MGPVGSFFIVTAGGLFVSGVATVTGTLFYTVRCRNPRSSAFIPGESFAFGLTCGIVSGCVASGVFAALMK